MQDFLWTHIATSACNRCSFSRGKRSSIRAVSIKIPKNETQVAGPSVLCLALASTLDIVDSIPVNYMHAVSEGVTRMLMRSWIDSRFHSAPFYIGWHVGEIDYQLLQQRPPNELIRPPRSVKKHFKYWKASELRNWLLFYSLPILLDFLPSLYWHHYALLVNSVHIMLVDFCVLLPELYGETSCTANAHLLCHLAKYVRLWGPLWTHSAFGFENKCGQLKHLSHGHPSSAALQHWCFLHTTTGQN